MFLCSTYFIFRGDIYEKTHGVAIFVDVVKLFKWLGNILVHFWFTLGGLYDGNNCTHIWNVSSNIISFLDLTIPRPWIIKIKILNYWKLISIHTTFSISISWSKTKTNNIFFTFKITSNEYTCSNTNGWTEFS